MDAMEKRKRVMARSIKLGHCVCDPRKPCPCPLFHEKNICTCAGERLAVTGLVEASAVVTNAGAAPGNVLILTKPLGTGIVTLAGQLGKASAESIAAAEASMGSLNKAASEIMVRHHATACTDVTGFGFLGHLCRLAIESGVTAEVWCDRLPLLPGVMDYAAQGIFSGAMRIWPGAAGAGQRKNAMNIKKEAVMPKKRNTG